MRMQPSFSDDKSAHTNVLRFQSDKLIRVQVLIKWRTNLRQRHLRDDGQHYFFPLCWIRILDMLD